MTFPEPTRPEGRRPSANELLTVGEVASTSGVAPSAVRFYDSHGVITAVRTATNQRRFDHSAPCRIQIAKLAQRVGLTVREIAQLFSALPAEPTAADWSRVAAGLISQAEQRVTDLRAQLDALESGDKLCEIGARLQY